MNENNQNKKFQQLVTTAHDLFMRYGIRRVTVEEICSEANISKMTFYKHFNNKIDLTKYLLNQIFSKQMNDYRRIMARQIPYPEKVKQIIQLKHEHTIMVSQEFFNDLWRKPIPEVVEMLEENRKESLSEVLNDLEAARKKGDIRQNINPEFILYFLNHMTEIAKDENLLSLYDSPNDLIMELTNFFFYGILPEKENTAA
jgi:AcrR family transcriptional regulator